MSLPPPHPSLLQRKIIHFDMDAFYASIEIRDDPTLAGKPVVVGGSPNSRAVVCTASYAARKFGIRSAMPCSQAARLCPEAIFLKPNFEKYQAASLQIRAIFRSYTPLIEPLSLDEAYLDVTNNARGLFAVKIARLIQEEVFETTRLTGSGGIGPNKLIAKIASDVRKPNGLTVVLPGQVQNFMGNLPLRKIHGIGPATEKRLHAEGFKICADVWPFTLGQLRDRLGDTMGAWLFERARGLDDRPVQPSRVRKSLGREETFAQDILDVGRLAEELAATAREVAHDLRSRKIRGRTITLKVRYADFSRITRSHSLAVATDEEATILEVARDLLGATEAGVRRIRLLGISLANFETVA